MSRVARIVPVLAALLCGVLAGRVLWSPMPDDYVRGGSRLPDALSANGAGVACAAVVAVLVTVALTRRRSVTLVTAAAVAGLLLLALPEVLSYPDDPAVLLYSNSVAAGMVLGAISPLAARDRNVQAALVGGAIGAFLLSGSVVDLRRFGSADSGWIGYAPLTSRESVEQSGVVGLWPAVVAAVLVVLTALVDRRVSWTARVDTRWLAVAAALPVAAFAANWILIESGARPEWWYPYVGVTVALVAWIAWQLPGRDGQVVFAGVAVLAAATGGMPWSSTDWWALAIPAALIVAGVATGLRWPVPVAGFALLAAVAAASLVAPEWDLRSIASMFVLPAAAGYVVGACLPTAAPASTVGLSLPFTVGIPGIAAAAWTITERYADYASSSVFEPQVSVSAPAAAVALAAIVLCGVGAWGLDLRSGARGAY
ncbi:hypothetical protein DEU38_11128 [Rhodococcus sp. AG1013]|uniref:hypothetical protein n=1 Tax=Rhodococcus sp. AG1013 TaxID=2183996 RepID=UPI000E0C98DB|nr:hypothetical protein [Rhodococcus sp. AG1013]RDI23951.1 hypothetical protein DEU38_11128 [Rhodococcus sp. AG1013]